MANYRLTNQAVEDLTRIWDYTFEKWSEKQADNYYKTLIATCGEIAKNPGLGKQYDGVATQLLGIKVNRHIVFYQIIDETTIEVIRILHEMMDLKNRTKQ